MGKKVEDLTNSELQNAQEQVLSDIQKNLAEKGSQAYLMHYTEAHDLLVGEIARRRQVDNIN